MIRSNYPMNGAPDVARRPKPVQVLMALPNPFDFLRLPTDLLIALDNRTFHFLLQPVHYLVRMVHLLTIAAFFGGIALLDIRLMGARVMMPLRRLADYILPWLWGTCAVAMVT